MGGLGTIFHRRLFSFHATRYLSHRLLGHLSASWEWLLLLCQLLNDLGELNHFLRLLSPRWQLRLFSKEGLTSCVKLRESVAHHLFATVRVGDSHLLEFINFLLGYALIVMPLLGSQITQVVIDVCERSTISVDLLIGGLTYAEDSEISIVLVTSLFHNPICNLSVIE